MRSMHRVGSVAPIATDIAGRHIMRKILSIDGGGIKGVFPASFLATVEDTVGGNVGDFFDLIVGTSTGGIIALGLGMGMSARDILQFYEDLGPIIFHGSRVGRILRSLVRAKYDQEPLRNALTNTFGDRRLGESKTRLMIPSLDLETGEVYIYKTSHVPHLQRDYKERIVDVALATAAAPTYFPTQRSAVSIADRNSPKVAEWNSSDRCSTLRLFDFSTFRSPLLSRQRQIMEDARLPFLA